MQRNKVSEVVSNNIAFVYSFVSLDVRNQEAGSILLHELHAARLVLYAFNSAATVLLRGGNREP
jgi:hypothetical protein